MQSSWIQNGSSPDQLKHLVEEGLVNYVAMDIKMLRKNTVKLPASAILISAAYRRASPI